MIARHDENRRHCRTADRTEFGEPFRSVGKFIRLAGESDISGYHNGIGRSQLAALTHYVSKQLISQMKIRILYGIDFPFAKMNIGKM